VVAVALCSTSLWGYNFSLVVSPLVTVASTFPSDFDASMNVCHAYSMEESLPFPFNGNMCNASFKDTVQNFPNHLLVQEVPTITIPSGKYVSSHVAHYGTNELLCNFNGLWLHLVDLYYYISYYYQFEFKEEAFIYAYANRFSIMVFDLAKVRDLTLEQSYLFFGKSSLSL